MFPRSIGQLALRVQGDEGKGGGGKGRETPMEIPFVPRSRCYGTIVSDATSTFLIVIRITGPMRSTSLNSDASGVTALVDFARRSSGFPREKDRDREQE